MGVATRVSPQPDGLATGGFGLKPAVSEALDRTVAEDATRAAVGLGHAEVLEKVEKAVLDAPTTEHNTIVLVRVHLDLFDELHPCQMAEHKAQHVVAMHQVPPNCEGSVDIPSVLCRLDRTHPAHGLR